MTFLWGWSEDQEPGQEIHLKELKVGPFVIQLDDRDLYEQLVHPKIPVTVRTGVPAPGHADMDWTEPFLERGTMMRVEGAVNATIPVERAYIQDEMLYVEGTAYV